MKILTKNFLSIALTALLFFAISPMAMAAGLFGAHQNVSKEAGGLYGDLFGLHLVDEAAHLGVLALGVFAHHDEIDVTAFGASERGVHARIEICGSHVGVLIEGAADG